MPFVYILECSDGSYYIGSTVNMGARLAQHQAGEGAEYTKRRLPVSLAWCGNTETISQAFYLEKKFQGWSRAKREAIIRGEWDRLPELSRNAEARAAAANRLDED